MEKTMNNAASRVTPSWVAIADEGIRIEQAGTFLRAYGSELACLRLFKAHYLTPSAKCEYSISMETWTFSIEI